MKRIASILILAVFLAGITASAFADSRSYRYTTGYSGGRVYTPCYPVRTYYYPRAYYYPMPRYYYPARVYYYPRVYYYEPCYAPYYPSSYINFGIGWYW